MCKSQHIERIHNNNNNNNYTKDVTPRSQS